MRYTRLIVGFVLIAAALWAIVGEQMAGTSADAYVNARLVTVRAPVAGRVAMPDRAFGAQVAAGETVASVEDALVDTIRLNDLLLEDGLLAAEARRLERVLDADVELLAGLDARSEAFARARVDELEIRLSHARARLALLRAGARSDGGEADLDTAEAGTAFEGDAPALALDRASERVELLQIALRTAREGVFLGDGYNDAPNAEQRAVELRGQIAATRAALGATARGRDALAERIDRERRRVNRLTGGDLAAPADGLLWEVFAADGAHVERGDPVLALVDCGAVIVSASVSEGLYNGLRAGQAARFRLTGSSEVHDATILRLAGAGAATIYRNLAVAPSRRHLERYDVTLSVPGLAADPDLACAIGRTGRVFLDRRPLDALRDLVR